MSTKLFPFWKLKVALCPSGEQWVNGGFEEDLSVGWINFFGLSRSTNNPHSGTYCLLLPYLTYVLSMDLIIPVKVSCVKSFILWGRSALVESGYDELTIAIAYTDGSTEYMTTGFSDTNWKKIDLTSILMVGLEITALYIFNGQQYFPVDVFADDVSLIGSG